MGISYNPASGGSSCAIDSITISQESLVGSTVFFTATVSGSSHGDTLSFDTDPVSGAGPKAYEVGHAFQVPSSSFPLTLVAEDVDDSSCTQSVVITEPVSSAPIYYDFQASSYGVDGSAWLDSVNALSLAHVTSGSSCSKIVDWRSSGQPAINVPVGAFFGADANLGVLKTDDWFAAGAGNSVTIWMAYTNTLDDNDAQFFNFTQGVATTNHQYRACHFGATPEAIMQGSDGTDSFGLGSPSVQPAIAILGIRVTGDLHESYLLESGNVVKESSDAAMDRTLTAIDTLMLGKYSTEVGRIEIGEFLVYDGSQSEAEWDATAASLTLKYGL